MKMAIIGATGMVGHVLFHEFKRKNMDVVGIGRRKIEKEIIPFDIFTDLEQIKLFLLNGKFDVIINCSAILVIESNINKMQTVYINSYFPHLLVDLFKDSDTKIVHLSTGGVFSGNEESYFEDSQISPQTYYGITKAAGEFNNDKDLVIRSDFWGPDNKKQGTGLFNWLLNQSGGVSAYSNVFFNGISNVELTKIIQEIIKNDGVVHIGTISKISKYDFIDKIKNIFHLENITLERNTAMNKNVFLKSKKTLPCIGNFDTMIEDVYSYLMENNQYYTDIYPKIYK